MARRARHNIEVITGRLTAAGYLFHDNDGSQTPATPHVPPTSAAGEHADWLEDRFGPVPLTILSWVRLTGDVWPVGTHPQRAASQAADPLVVELEGSRYGSASFRRSLEDDHEGWRTWLPQPGDSLYTLPVAPDRLHKASTSGGEPYGIIVPDGCADALITGETTMAFVDYLNWVFRNGGFPWPADPDSQWRIRDTLAADLLPL